MFKRKYFSFFTIVFHNKVTQLFHDSAIFYCNPFLQNNKVEYNLTVKAKKQAHELFNFFSIVS